MFRIECHDAPMLRSLMAELGISTEQEVANIAIDAYNHCMTKIAASGEACRMDLEYIRQINPVAIVILRLTRSPLRIRASVSGQNPITLALNEERSAAVHKWKRKLGLGAEHYVLTNAVMLLQSLVRAKRSDDSVMVYKVNSELHTRRLQGTTPPRSDLPPPRTTTLLN